ncbi:HET domain containing protein, partial [Pyrenophora tritici-repentis]
MVTPSPLTWTLRLKSHKTTVLLHVDPLTTFESIKSSLYDALQETGFKNPETDESIPLPASASDIQLGRPVNFNDANEGFQLGEWEYSHAEEDEDIFTIPHNLFNFFTAAHDKAASEGPAALGPYWMDALCIDQSNVLERNHQVAQMSKIYAGARCVYIWLGKMDVLSIAPVIQQGNEKTSPSERFLRNKVACRDFITCVVGNGYWTRAWIIQEFMLASHIIVWLNDRCMTFADLAISLDVVYRVEPFYQEIDNFLEKWDRRSYQYGDLICMLIRFRHARCYDPRDRIFSLLSLVRGEGQDLQVDYGISRAELAAEVLRQSPSSFCFCTAVFVAQALGVEYTEPPFINPKTTSDRNGLVWSGLR